MLNKDGSPVKLTVSKLENRKNSHEQIPAGRKDDIFGKSYDREMQGNSATRPNIQEETKSLKGNASMQAI